MNIEIACSNFGVYRLMCDCGWHFDGQSPRTIAKMFDPTWAFGGAVVHARVSHPQQNIHFVCTPRFLAWWENYNVAYLFGVTDSMLVKGT